MVLGFIQWTTMLLHPCMNPSRSTLKAKTTPSKGRAHIPLRIPMPTEYVTTQTSACISSSTYISILVDHSTPSKLQHMVYHFGCSKVTFSSIISTGFLYPSSLLQPQRIPTYLDSTCPSSHQFIPLLIACHPMPTLRQGIQESRVSKSSDHRRQKGQSFTS